MCGGLGPPGWKTLKRESNEWVCVLCDSNQYAITLQITVPFCSQRGRLTTTKTPHLSGRKRKFVHTLKLVLLKQGKFVAGFNSKPSHLTSELEYGDQLDVPAAVTLIERSPATHSVRDEWALPDAAEYNGFAPAGYRKPLVQPVTRHYTD
jgi:hypothetical protein